MTLFENIKRRFLKEPSQKKTSSTIDPQNIEVELGNDSVGFLDDSSSGLLYDNQDYSLETALQKQKSYIDSYRRIARLPEVDFAVGEVADEVLFTVGTDDPLVLEFDSELGEKTKEALQDEFDKVMQKINANKNLYTLFQRFYIDGQLNIHVGFLNSARAQAEGIYDLRIISPLFLYLDLETNKYRYMDDLGIIPSGSTKHNPFSGEDYDVEFDREEIIRITSGIFEGPIILSDIHNAVRVSNMLSTLEEMLIPLRFSRSVSRRVFNVDVADMSANKAQEFIEKLKNKFKYKKYFNVQEGTISNQQQSIGLVEDYWFPNRSGSKGTTVETLDERGSLGELEDITYMQKKLYSALKIPTSRIPGAETTSDFDYSATSVQREELKFFNFCERKRKQFLELFYELLKRQILSKHLMTEDEFNECLNYFSIRFSSSNKFLEKMEREIFNERVQAFDGLASLIEGGYVSRKFLYEKVLGFSEDEIEELQKEIQLEQKDPNYYNILNKVDDDSIDKEKLKKPEEKETKEFNSLTKEVFPEETNLDLLNKFNGTTPKQFRKKPASREMPVMQDELKEEKKLF